MSQELTSSCIYSGFFSLCFLLKVLLSNQRALRSAGDRPLSVTEEEQAILVSFMQQASEQLKSRCDTHHLPYLHYVVLWYRADYPRLIRIPTEVWNFGSVSSMNKLLKNPQASVSHFISREKSVKTQDSEVKFITLMTTQRRKNLLLEIHNTDVKKACAKQRIPRIAYGHRCNRWDSIQDDSSYYHSNNWLTSSTWCHFTQGWAGKPSHILYQLPRLIIWALTQLHRKWGNQTTSIFVCLFPKEAKQNISLCTFHISKVSYMGPTWSNAR